jgi:hypothetical protein
MFQQDPAKLHKPRRQNQIHWSDLKAELQFCQISLLDD